LDKKTEGILGVKELMVRRRRSMYGNIYKKCTPTHPLKTTCRIPRIPCYLCHHGQNYIPLNFGTDPISVQDDKYMFIPSIA
jgi:hypothetical protein